MCIFDKEFKPKSRKKKNVKRETQEVRSESKSYKPRTSSLRIGVNDKRDPVPSYWKLR